jgi:hypothetical protein
MITAKRSDLVAKLGRTCVVTAGESNREGELQFLQLVISLGLKIRGQPVLLGTAGRGATGQGARRSRGLRVGERVSHALLSSYSDTACQGA